MDQLFRLSLFDHLPRKQVNRDPDLIEDDFFIHPSTSYFGSLLQKGIIQSDDDRAYGLISTLIHIIEDYKTPPNAILRHDLDKFITKQVQYIVECRPLTKGMGNIIKFTRSVINNSIVDENDEKIKSSILTKLKNFIDEKLIFASASISKIILNIINPNDVILTYGSSPLLTKILLECSKKKKFNLIIIDSRPLNNGLDLLAQISSSIHCIYSPLSGAAYLMKDVTKVLLGASCMMSNGSMLAPAGTAMVAALATKRQIPVIVCSESYKFSEQVQLDSIVFNELGNINEIAQMITVQQAQSNGIEIPASYANQPMFPIPQLVRGYRGTAEKITENNPNKNSNEPAYAIPSPSLTSSATITSDAPTSLPFEVVNLRYDLTPLHNISVIATETGLIPPTSVPVLIREMINDKEINKYK